MSEPRQLIALPGASIRGGVANTTKAILGALKGQIVTRAKLYAGSFVASFEMGRAWAHGLAIDPNALPVGPDAPPSGITPFPDEPLTTPFAPPPDARPKLPYLPADGGTPCRSGCRCHWDVDRDDVAGVWRCTWVTEGDGNVCSGCLDRAARANPLIVPFPEG